MVGLVTIGPYDEVVDICMAGMCVLCDVYIYACSIVCECLQYAVEDEMNLCILSEGKRMLEPSSDIFGEFRRQRHRVLGLFLLLTVCLFTICIIGWSCSSRV